MTHSCTWLLFDDFNHEGVKGGGGGVEGVEYQRLSCTCQPVNYTHCHVWLLINKLELGEAGASEVKSYLAAYQ